MAKETSKTSLVNINTYLQGCFCFQMHILLLQSLLSRWLHKLLHITVHILLVSRKCLWETRNTKSYQSTTCLAVSTEPVFYKTNESCFSKLAFLFTVVVVLLLGIRMRRVRLAQKNIWKYASRYPL